MAHKKAGGSSKNGRDSRGKRLGIKKYGGELVKSGNIIVRQRGSTYHAGVNAAAGRDFTIFAVADGIVEFKQGNKLVVNVLPVEGASQAA